MNDHDRQNLEFILTRSHEELVQWFRAIEDFGDQSEIDYALEMLQAARNHIELELLEVFDREADADVSKAATYLQKFQLQ